VTAAQAGATPRKERPSAPVARCLCNAASHRKRRPLISIPCPPRCVARPRLLARVYCAASVTVFDLLLRGTRTLRRCSALCSHRASNHARPTNAARPANPASIHCLRGNLIDSSTEPIHLEHVEELLNSLLLASEYPNKRSNETNWRVVVNAFIRFMNISTFNFYTHTTEIWLILPVVICLFQGLSHACLRMTALQESAHGSLHQT
jgi:hypothetical protein